MQWRRQFVFILVSLWLLFIFASQISAQTESLKEVKKRIEKAFEKQIFLLQLPNDTTGFQLELPKSAKTDFDPATPYFLKIEDVDLQKKKIDIRARRVYIFQNSKKKLQGIAGEQARYRIKWQMEISSPDQWASILTKILIPADSVTVESSRYWPPDLPKDHGKKESQPSRELTPGIYSVGTDTTEPMCAYCPHPEYPEAAKAQQRGGKVGMVIVITEEGNIAGIRLAKPANPLLVASSIVAVSGWRYKPALRSGKPVRVAILLEIIFRFN